MGSTVSTGKLVAAFQGANGPMYVLFEETYESNSYPHTPRWSCMAVCTLESALRHIFRSASSCEGGMLKGSGGRDITPEGYIAGWMKALANPVAMADQTFDLSVGGDYSSTVPMDLFAAFGKDNLCRIGKAELAGKLDAGETVRASLFDNSDVIAALFDGFSIGAWRIIRSTPLHAPCVPALGYNPSKAKAPSLDLPGFMVIPNTVCGQVLQQGADGWRCAGAGYSLVASFVANAWRTELSHPGSYRAQIKEFRAAVETAPAIPDGMSIVVDTSALPGRRLTTLEKILPAIPHSRSGTEVWMAAPTNSDHLYYVTSWEQAVWHLPEEHERLVARQGLANQCALQF